MPTPPIGDMAWAASPIASSPGRCQRVSRSSSTVSSLTWSQLSSSPTGAGTAPWRRRRRGNCRAPFPAAPPPCPWRRHRRIANNRRGRARRAAGRWRSRRSTGCRACAPSTGGTRTRRSARRDPRAAARRARAAASARPSAAMTSFAPDRRCRLQTDAGDPPALPDEVGRLGVHPQLEAGIGRARGRRRNRGTPIAASAR